MKTLSEIVAALPPDERAQVTARAQELISEEQALRSLRKARQLTQERMAQLLHMRQASISKLENRTDLLLSTLRSYIEAMGGNLRLVVEFPDGFAELSSIGENEIPVGDRHRVKTKQSGRRLSVAHSAD
jgi:transcriptional regulator with XRE-family HTH domain